MKKISILLLMSMLLLIQSCGANEQIIENIENDETLTIPKAANYEISEKLLKNETEIEERTDRIYQDMPIENTSIVEIDEKKFLTKIDNIKRKIDQYKDKTIVVEGMFATYSSWDDSFKANLVYRNGPNDFNNDIWAGFFLDDLKGQQIQIDDWIRVEGMPYIQKVKDTEGTEYEYLFLNVNNIAVLPNSRRGLEFVNE